MTQDDKMALINRYEHAVAPLIAFLRDLPNPLLDFRPNLAGAWTIREHAVHFLDADTFAHARIRLCVTEPGSEVFVWNEEAWQERGCYETADPLASLQACATLRMISAAMARSLVDNDWEQYYVRHPQRGRLTLSDVLRIYTEHAQFHFNYLERNVQAARGGHP
jgi:hypothetical protein